MSGDRVAVLAPPPVRYATATDGVRIGYMRYPGAEPPFLSVATPGTPPLSLRTSILPHGRVMDAFRRGRAGVHFDWRGSGASDPVFGTLCIDDLVADLDAITAAIGEPVDAISWGRACFAMCLHASEAPSRYRSIKIDAGALRSGESWQGLYNRPGWEPHYSEHLQGLARHYFNASPHDAVRIAALWEKGVPAHVFSRYVEAERDLDLTDILPNIQVPVWVTARLPVDYEPATNIAALLPNATLTLYPPEEGVGDRLGEAGRDEWDRYLGASLGDPLSISRKRTTASTTEDAAVLITKREREVLAFVAAGDSNRQIAAALNITEGTVKRHVSNLLQKTELQNRRQLMRLWDERSAPA